jgi:hypothetical protein
LKYQRQCIEKGEQNLAERAEEAANEVTNTLILRREHAGDPVMDWRPSTPAPIASAKDAHDFALRQG